jgi:hypothetical protein
METETTPAPSVDLAALLRHEEQRLAPLERSYTYQLARVELLRELLAALAPPAPPTQEPAE